MNAETLAISTCWNSARHSDGYAMAVELAELGFKRMELSHGIRISLVPGILRALDEEIIAVSSVHNFCPLPSGVQHAAPNFYQPSAGRNGERTLWTQYTMKTMDFALQTGARHVIMHSGSASFFFFDPVARFEKWLEGRLPTETDQRDLRNLTRDPDYGKRLDRALKKMARRETSVGPRLTEAFRPVVAAAAERGIVLCIENREGLDELPTDPLIPLFLEALGPPPEVSYWHDTGHAQIKQLLGVQPQEAFLESNQQRLAGFHLHDVSPAGKDHLPPGKGTIDWKALRPFFRKDLVYVLELSPRLKPEQVLDGKAFLEDLG